MWLVKSLVGDRPSWHKEPIIFLNKMLSIRKVRLLITSRYIAMQSYECVIISKMFLIYFISYGCNGGALVFLGGAEASASPSFALPMFITIKKIIILHLFLGVPAATVSGTGTPWHTRGYAPAPHHYTTSSSLNHWDKAGWIHAFMFFTCSCYCCLSIISNQSVHSPLTSDINKAFSSSQLPLNGYFLFFGPFSVNPRGVVCENPSRSAVLAVKCMKVWRFELQVVFTTSRCLNALSCCHVIGWLAICVTKQLNRCT